MHPELGILLAAQASAPVGKVNIELLGTLNDGLALQGRHAVGNLAGELPAV